MAITCPVCHQPIAESDAYCPKCGARSPIYEEFVDAPPEGYVAPDPTNPYAAPQVDNSPVYRLDWIRLARSLKMMNISFLFIIIFAIADKCLGNYIRSPQFEGFSSLGVAMLIMFSVFTLTVRLFFVVGVVNTAGALGHSVIARILWAICAFLIPLVPLLVLEAKSNNRLRAAGFRPGFFYPDMKQFEWSQTDPNDPYLDPRGPIQKQ